ncbi:MAG: restriction endonuclease subunit S [Caldilineaceae bacterium]
MTHNLKPYPAYKDSGVPWLGEVPEHWETRKLRNILTGISERNRPDLPLLSVVREKGVILRDVTNKDENHNYIPDDLTNYKVVWHGQFAMNKMKAWQGSFGVSQHEGIVSPAYFIFDVQNVDGGYFHKAIRSKVYVPFFTQASDGVRIGQWDLSQVRMKEIPFFVPPSDEQAAIVRYLDYMDRRIRRFIRAKQTLIKLLEEQKQSIIQQAVTGQIDVLTGQPYPAYKPSGVEWLGEVPEHWDVMPLRRVTITRCDGPFGSGLKSAHYTSHGIRVVRLQNIGHAEFKNADDAYISPSHYATLGDHTVEPGDLLIAGLGDERHPAGRACVAPAFISPAMVKADCFRFRLYTRHLNPEFAALHLTATAVDASAILSIWSNATTDKFTIYSSPFNSDSSTK